MKKELISRSLFITLLLIILTVIVVLMYFIYLYPILCKDKTCFQSAMQRCRRADFIKEDDTASWLYRIVGNGKTDKDSCSVEVTLLNLKKGSVEIEKLQGKKMMCEVKRYDQSDPGSDINKCTGPLKEELQGIIIQKLNNYLVSNINEIIPRLSS